MKKINILAFLLVSIGVFAQKNKQPKLVVGIVIDQMCYEYLYRYQNQFGPDGFKKLMTGGTHCRNTQYNYVPTFTAPGHASIYTGTTPSNHGIVANDWYNRNAEKVMNSVADTNVFGIGTNSEYGLRSPHNLKANTITDQLKLTYPNTKVISLSIKDRSAILPGGHLSDGSYWFDYVTGQFVTSSFYKKEMPFWVTNFNNKKYPDHYLTQTWNTLLPIEQYKASGIDNSPYEELVSGKTTPTFPYDLAKLSQETKDYSLFTFTPFANTYLTDFAIESIYNEVLGQDNIVDMLCISYSTPDIAGHMFGPYAVEMEDLYIRLDQEIARLIKALEERVGKDEFVLFLTADHAVMPVPQYLIDHKLPGGYFFKEDKMLELIDNVKSKFNADLILTDRNCNIYLDQELIRTLNLKSEEVEEFIAAEIRMWEGVKAVYTTKHFNSVTNGDTWSEMIRLGYHPKESGEIIFLLEPGYHVKTKDSEDVRKGTTHGSPFNYDTHVPLIWYGKKIPKQEIFRRIDITDITATLVHILNVQKPNATIGEPILEILSK